MIALTSDHGEEFWEHGGFEHGHQLYDELLHVPLILKLPASEFRGRMDEPVSTVRLARTLLEVSGVPFAEAAFDASSLVGSWSVPTTSREDYPIVSRGLLDYEDRISVIFDNWKYIRAIRGEPSRELYELTRGKTEQTSIVESDTEQLRRAEEPLPSMISALANCERRLALKVWIPCSSMLRPWTI